MPTDQELHKKYNVDRRQRPTKGNAVSRRSDAGFGIGGSVVAEFALVLLGLVDSLYSSGLASYRLLPYGLVLL